MQANAVQDGENPCLSIETERDKPAAKPISHDLGSRRFISV
jgi:hypothetical protein